MTTTPTTLIETPVRTESSVGGTVAPLSRRLDFIDALRGFACLCVLICHTYAFYPIKPGILHLPFKLVVWFADIGWLGVSLFLVLSGFCLYYPLVCRQPVRAVSLKLRSYALRRCLRILPPYYGVILILVLMGRIGGHFSEHSALHSLAGFGHFSGPLDVFAHLFMVFNLNPLIIGSVNGPFWSLALEFQLYIVFPLLILLAARYGLRGMLISTLALAVVWQLGVFVHLKYNQMGTDATKMVWYYALPGRCFEFAAGMATAALVARRPDFMRRQARLICLLLPIPAALLVLKYTCFAPLMDQVWGVIFVCMILWIASIPEIRFHQVTAARWLVRVGVISYSVYLIHMPAFCLLTPERFHVNIANEPAYFCFGILRIPIVVGLGALAWRIIELPFIRMSKAIGRRAERVPAVVRGV